MHNNLRAGPASLAGHGRTRRSPYSVGMPPAADRPPGDADRMLTADHLTRQFDARVAVQDISFELRPGEILALLGPNGAGKTTTLRLLAGLIRPSSGQVLLDGVGLHGLDGTSLRTRIGILTEAPGLWDRLTVRQNLLTYARLHGLPSPSRAVDEALDLFDVRSRAGDLAAHLSKGLRQRVALARTLLHRPGIVLLDEPTSGLDPASAKEVRALILRLRGEGRAVLLSTHNLDEVDRVADRVAVLRGRLLALGTTAALRARFFGERLKVTVSGDAQQFVSVLGGSSGVDIVRADGPVLLADGAAASAHAPEIVRRLVAAGADILSVHPEHVSLEEVYLHLLGEGSTES